MPRFYDNLGIDELFETEEIAMQIIGYAIENGKGIVGYSGNPYVNYEFGGAQLIVRTILNKEEDRLEFSGLDTHMPGNAVWEVMCNGIDLTPKEADPLEKRCVFCRSEDGGGMAVINVINADVIPSYMNEDIIKLQMIGFALKINYYENDEEIDALFPTNELGKRCGITDGRLFPVGFISSHMAANGEFLEEEDDWADNIMLVKAKVKSIYWGTVKLTDDEEFNRFIICRIDTEFGELEIVHSVDQVDEEDRGNLKIGATVFARIVLSGDAAIYEYEQGFIRNEENNLRVLRSVFEGESADKLQLILTEDAKYLSDLSETEYNGKEEYIERLKYVSEQSDTKYYAHMATITGVEDGEKTLSESEGKRCIVLAADSESNYESIVFINCDKRGYIERMHITTESRYRFKIDDSPVKVNPFEGMNISETYIEAMVLRAKYHSFIKNEFEADQLAYQSEESYDDINNAEKMLEAWPEEVDIYEEEHMKNMFGYLFAKAIEGEYTKQLGEILDDQFLINSYRFEDAWEDAITSKFIGEKHRKLEIAMKYGKQFYKDFNNYITRDNVAYKDELIRALVTVQRLGKLCAKEYMKETNSNGKNES